MKRLLLPVLLVALAGCGSAPRAMDPQIREQLLGHVEAVKTAAQHNDRPAAEAALGDLHRAIAEAQARGELATENARTLLAATERVAQDVRTMPLPEPPAPVTVTVEPAPPPVVAPPAPEPGQHGRERAEEQARKWQEMREAWEHNREAWREARDDHGRHNGKNNGNGDD
ncbi:hypothetical protein ABT324_22185 [Saccharopolyspora sp. NPDC000359]|uniref:hypothetical protein n=1 Tax=Saccharopolyspora sp. NPDC000359 TaxID=3154251 RepID=UPI00331BA57D